MAPTLTPRARRSQPAPPRTPSGRGAKSARTLTGEGMFSFSFCVDGIDRLFMALQISNL
jgi:hypothetical protein